MQCDAMRTPLYKNRRMHKQSIWINTGISYNALPAEYYDGFKTHCCCAVISLSLFAYYISYLLRFVSIILWCVECCCCFLCAFSLSFFRFVLLLLLLLPPLLLLLLLLLLLVFVQCLSTKVKLYAHQTKNSQNSLRDKIYAYIYTYIHCAYLYFFSIR